MDGMEQVTLKLSNKIQKNVKKFDNLLVLCQLTRSIWMAKKVLASPLFILTKHMDIHRISCFSRMVAALVQALLYLSQNKLLYCNWVFKTG
jgi:tRNA pseudouridine-54 N-methylase